MKIQKRFRILNGVTTHNRLQILRSRKLDKNKLSGGTSGTVHKISLMKRIKHLASDTIKRALPSKVVTEASDYRLKSNDFPYHIARFDSLLRHIYVNETVVKSGQWTAKQYVGTSLTESGLPIPIARKLEKSIRSVFLTGFQVDVDHEVPTPAGIRLFHTSLVPERSSEGDVETVLSLAQDITDSTQAEKALKESEEKLRLIIDNAREYIWTMDKKFVINWLSPSMSKIIGYALEDLADKPVVELMAPGSKALWDELTNTKFSAMQLDNMTADIGFEAEFEFRTHDGTFFWSNISVTLLRDGKRNASGYLCIGRDVTERIHIQEALRVSEVRYRRLFEAAQDGILILDVQTGKIMDVNPFLITLTGFSKEDFLDKSIWEIGPFKNIAASKASLRELQANGYVRYEDLPLKTHDGRIINVEFVSNIYAVGDKNVIQCNIRDITSRVQSQKELEFKNLILSTQQEAAIDGILVVDTEGRIISSNRRFREMWDTPSGLENVKSQEPILESLKQKIKNPQEFMDRIQYLYAHPKEKSESEMEMTDGRSFERYTSAMLDADEKSFGRVWYFRDVTARKKAADERVELEAQLRGHQKMEAIGGLAGGIAHDFNNLICVILSYTSFALKQILEGDPMREDLLEIKNAGERAALLTRQLLAFSSKQILKPVPLNLNEIIKTLEKMLKRILGEDIALELSLSPDLCAALVDPGQIEQVVMNLVVNARDAMPEGGKLKIETINLVVEKEYIATRVNMKPGAYVQLSVSDTGCGMDEQTKSRIFEPFFTTKEKSKGTGLGLSTVYGIIKQSNGSIWVYSELGHGTVFKIYLPSIGAVEKKAAIIQEKIIRSTVKNETILMVEDEPALRKIIEKTLVQAGYDVLLASDGKEAIRISAQHDGIIPLLLTDVVMPGLGGRILARSISKSRPETRVIYMSGYGNDAIAHHGVLDMGTHFLSKPFSADELLNKISEVLNGQSMPHDDSPADNVIVEPEEKGEPPCREDLAALPEEMKVMLEKALIMARSGEIIDLVNKIKIISPKLATALRRMVDNFDYQGIRSLLN